MENAIIWITIAVYFVAMLALGLVSSKNAKGLTSFTVGKRDAGGWVSALSYGTAYFSAVMFVGYSGNSGWSFGLWSVLVGIGNALFGTLLAWILLAKPTREVSRRLKIKSMPQLFEKRYLSSGMKTFSAIVIFIFLIPYSASVYKGLTSICATLLHIDDTICMILIAILSAIILVVGGYLATLKADFVQGIIMMFGIIALIICVMVSKPVVDGGSIAGMWKFMQDNGMDRLNSQNWTMLIATILMTSFGTWGLPQMIHKYYGIKDDKEVKRGTVVSTVFAFLVAGGGYFIGSLSHLYFGNELPEKGKDYIVPLLLKESNLPSILLGIILVLLISASVSTLSSITLTASSTFTMDLIGVKSKKAMSDKKAASVTRIFCLLFVVMSYFIATTDTPILDMMSYSWGIISGSFLAPYVLCLFYKKLNKAGAWAGMLGGFAIALLPATSKILTYFIKDNATINKLAAQGPIYAVIAMLVSLLLCFIVSEITTKKYPPQTYSEFYNKKV